MQGPEPVTLAIGGGGVARIVLADPDNRNAVSARSSAAFLATTQQAVTAPGVCVSLPETVERLGAFANRQSGKGPQ